MGLKGLTVETAPQKEAHIQAADDRAIWEAIIGKDGVADVGQRLKGSLISNNQFRVYDGALAVGGAIGRIPFGEYEDVTIYNGTQNQKRHDLIVAQFEAKDAIEDMKIICIQGTPGETAEDPSYTVGNIYEGETLRQYPLYRVKLDGLNIEAVEQMFEVMPNMVGLQEKVSELNRKLPFFLDFHANGNEQMVFKTDSGFMIITGTYQASNIGSKNPVNNCYNNSVKFEVPFVSDDISSFVTPRYAGGIPLACIASQDKNQVTVACDVNVQGAWLQWVAMGRWK